MERKSGESAEIRNLQEKLSQLNQNVLKITDEKVSMEMYLILLYFCISILVMNVMMFVCLFGPYIYVFWNVL